MSKLEKLFGSGDIFSVVQWLTARHNDRSPLQLFKPAIQAYTQPLFSPSLLHKIYIHLICISNLILIVCITLQLDILVR